MQSENDFLISVSQEISRRRFTAYFSSIGLAASLLPGILWAKMQEANPPKITPELLANAEQLAGLSFTDEERKLMVDDLNDNLGDYDKIHAVPLPNSVPPAIHFNPVLPGMSFSKEQKPIRYSESKAVTAPSTLEEVAFWPITRLAQLIRDRQVKSVDLTTMYLARLKKYDSKLHCVTALTEERALEQAERADVEIAAGRYLGPLHGIPWGAKDLLAVRGYPTTWGSTPYRDQQFDHDAAVVQRLDAAGAVLIAKLTLGELAWGDVWYGGKTRNPWNVEQGASGSSAGPGAATAAGLVGFSIGTETWGSIVSPSTRCGVTGLRPTYGRVSRYGAMALSWSMDKIGPMCRSVEDCAIVFNAIHGLDPKDNTLVDLPFNWDVSRSLSGLRVGYYKSAFDARRENKSEKTNDDASLETLRILGVTLIPIELQKTYPVEALSFILNTEASAAFDELTRSNRDDLMARQERNAWPNAFRFARFTPAVEYIQANRIRTLIMQEMAKLFETVDVYLTPSSGNDSLLTTNLTGHPTVVLPNGFDEKGSPTSVSFVGNLFAEAETLLIARAYQEATGFHLKHPAL